MAGTGADTSLGGANSSGGGRPSNAGSDNGAGAEPGPVGGAGGEGGAAGLDIIRATVVDQDGEPFAGVTLLIDDMQLETDAAGQAMTAGEGRASFTAMLIAAESKAAYVFDGVTRRELHFVLPRVDAAPLVTGKLEGTVNTDLAAENLQVTFVDLERDRSFFGFRNVTDVAPDVRYEINPSWSGGTLNGNVRALNWMKDPGFSVPSSYAIGFVPASLTPNATVAGLDITLSQVMTRDLPVTITAPVGATRDDFLLLGPFSVSNLSPSAATLTYMIPDDERFDDEGMAMQFVSTCTFGEVGGANSTVAVPLTATLDSIDETCPTPPELNSPPDEATGITHVTPLAFTTNQTGCNAVNVSYVSQAWTVTVWTLENEVVLPDLSAWGLDYDAQDVDWTASTSGPCDSVDVFLQPPTGQPLGDLPRFTFGRSDHRTFTTAP